MNNIKEWNRSRSTGRNRALLVVFALFLANCNQTNCRVAREKNKETKSANFDATNERSTMDFVEVYKLDGTIQCEDKKSIPAELMQKELGAIKVISYLHKKDGMMRMMKCGAPTGFANVYKIPKEDLQAAIKLGFQQWIWD